MKRALILASEKSAEWHPWSTVRDAVLAAFIPDFTCMVAIDRVPALDEIDGLDLVVNLLDVWEKPVPEALVSLLSSWISGGGGLLSVHQGISLARDPRLLPLLGARFDGHPPICPLHFHADSSLRARYSVNGTDLAPVSLVLEEEGYRTIPAPDAKLDILLSFYECPEGIDTRSKPDSGESFPAAWFVDVPTAPLPQGILAPVRARQSAWFMPGHTAASFHEPAFAHFLGDLARLCVAG